MSARVLVVDLLLAAFLAAIVVLVSPGWAVVAIFAAVVIAVCTLSTAVGRLLGVIARRRPKA